MARRISFRWVVLAAVLIVIGVALGRALLVAREDACQTVCYGQMYYLYHALLNYHSANGHFPPAYIEGPDGTPWHSWRILLLPYLEEDDVYKRYNFDEPWNGPNNRRLADKIHVQLFQCPSGRDRQKSGFTNYCVVTGNGTAFPGAETASMSNPLESTSRSIMLVEISHSDIHWMEPRDIRLENLIPDTGPRFGSPHPLGVGVVRANRTCERIKELRIQSLVEQLQFSDN